MAKWYGVIGFAETVEVEPGVHIDEVIERPYFGDIIRNVRNLQSAGVVNDNINVNNEISILADPYANNHFHTMKYISFAGAKWKISSVDASQYPRLRLTIGGVWNGEQT